MGSSTAGDDDDDVYAVNRIAGKKLENGRVYFLVQWEGYGEEDDSWVLNEDAACDEAIADFEAAIRKQHNGVFPKLKEGSKILLPGVKDPEAPTKNVITDKPSENHHDTETSPSKELRTSCSTGEKSKLDTTTDSEDESDKENHVMQVKKEDKQSVNKAGTKRKSKGKEKLSKKQPRFRDSMVEATLQLCEKDDILQRKYLKIWPDVVKKVGKGKASRFLQSVRQHVLKYSPREIKFSSFAGEKKFVTSNGVDITVTNDVDDEERPDFHFVEKLLLPENAPQLDTSFNVACDCIVCDGECHNGKSMYTLNGLYQGQSNEPIYECTDRCACVGRHSSCSNRVVQKGAKVPLNVYKTVDRGWAVRATCKISKGTFIGEYVGEVLTIEEAKLREEIYATTKDLYVFDMDYDGGAVHVVDATYFGNVTRLINHSCEPNLILHTVFIESLDPEFYHLALFATRDIMEGEELTLDYGDGILNRFKCKCRSKACRSKR